MAQKGSRTQKTKHEKLRILKKVALNVADKDK
jgi:hypothetical protein